MWRGKFERRMKEKRRWRGEDNKLHILRKRYASLGRVWLGIVSLVVEGCFTTQFLIWSKLKNGFKI